MEVMQAGLEQIDALVALRCELWPDDAITHRDELTALFERPTYAAFLAAAGRPLGFAEATLREYVDGIPLGPPAAYLEGLFVVADARRQGIATTLLTAVEHWAAAHGCTDIGSDAEIDNSAGEAWHCALGFVENGRTINYGRRLVRRSDNLMDVS